MAIITRWRSPPDSWYGYCRARRAGSGTRTRSSAATAAASAALRRQVLMDLDRLGDLAAHRHHRIQRGHRLLEDHRDRVAADAAHLGLGQGQQVAPVEPDVAGLDPRRRRGQQALDRERGDALAAARFADHRERLAPDHLEGDAVDRADHALGGIEADAQALDPEHDVIRLAVRARPLGLLDQGDGGAPRCPGRCAGRDGRLGRRCKGRAWSQVGRSFGGAAQLTKHSARLS